MDRQQARLWDFIRAYWPNWFALMSGGPSVPAAIFAYYVEAEWAKVLLWVTAAACFVLSAYFVWRAERHKVIELTDKTTQKFKLSFHPESEGIATTPIRIPRTVYGSQQIITQTYNGNYVRIRVESISAMPVRRCVAFLTRLQKESANENTCTDISLPHSVALRGGQQFDVHPGTICTVDFLMCSSEDNKIKVPDCTWPFALEHAFDETGTYRFTITVNGDGISDSITVAVGWPGQWDRITAKQVQGTQ